MTVALIEPSHALIQEKPVTEYRFFKSLTQLAYVEAIYLYGSRARASELRSGSDFDLGIVCPTATHDQWIGIERSVRQNDETLVKVDAVRLDQLTDQPFLTRIIRDRKILYLREHYAGDNISLREKLNFIREWDGKMIGWSNHLSEITAGVPHPDEAQTMQAFTSFHHAFDSAFILYRKCLALHGMYTNTPLSSFREATIEGWITDRPVWEAMLEDSHNTRGPDVKMETRFAVYKRFPAFIEAFTKASFTMQQLIRPFEQAGSHA